MKRLNITFLVLFFTVFTVLGQKKISIGSFTSTGVTFKVSPSTNKDWLHINPTTQAKNLPNPDQINGVDLEYIMPEIKLSKSENEIHDIVREAIKADEMKNNTLNRTQDVIFILITLDPNQTEHKLETVDFMVKANTLYTNAEIGNVYKSLFDKYRPVLTSKNNVHKQLKTYTIVYKYEATGKVVVEPPRPPRGKKD